MVMRWRGQLPVFNPSADADKFVDDFRDVPGSDRGNDCYEDQGMLGNYQADGPDRRMPPAETKFFGGFGAEDEDLKRGFCVPNLREQPAYDKENYINRSCRPKQVDEDFANTSVLQKDWEFQGRNNQSKGFLTRKRLPTERG